MTTKRFERDAATGNVTGVVTARVAWKKDAQGRMGFEEVPGSEQTWPADLCLLALGFLGPEGALAEELGIQKDPRRATAAGPPSPRPPLPLRPFPFGVLLVRTTLMPVVIAGATLRRSTAASTRRPRGSSPPATAAAASRSSSGPSRRAAARRRRWGSSWAWAARPPEKAPAAAPAARPGTRRLWRARALGRRRGGAGGAGGAGSRSEANDDY